MSEIGEISGLPTELDVELETLEQERIYAFTDTEEASSKTSASLQKWNREWQSQNSSPLPEKVSWIRGDKESQESSSSKQMETRDQSQSREIFSLFHPQTKATTRQKESSSSSTKETLQDKGASSKAEHKPTPALFRKGHQKTHKVGKRLLLPSSQKSTKNQKWNPFVPQSAKQKEQESMLSFDEPLFAMQDQEQEHEHSHDEEDEVNEVQALGKRRIKPTSSDLPVTSLPLPKTQTEASLDQKHVTVEALPTCQDPYLAIALPSMMATIAKISILSAFFLIDRLISQSEGQSLALERGEIAFLSREYDRIAKIKLQALVEAVAKERSANTWGTIVSVLSFIGSFTALLTGMALIVSGAGVLAGSLLVAGGLLQIASQIMQVTKGWDWVTENLPGDGTKEEKQAVVTWMQITIGALALLLGAGAIIFGGGFQNVMGEAGTAFKQVFGGIIAVSQGYFFIGEGIAKATFNKAMAKLTQFEAELERMRHRREERNESVEEHSDQFGEHFKVVAKILEIYQDTSIQVLTG